MDFEYLIYSGHTNKILLNIIMQISQYKSFLKTDLTDLSDKDKIVQRQN